MPVVYRKIADETDQHMPNQETPYSTLFLNNKHVSIKHIKYHDDIAIPSFIVESGLLLSRAMYGEEHE
jgi:hypothetical protein